MTTKEHRSVHSSTPIISPSSYPSLDPSTSQLVEFSMITSSEPVKIPPVDPSVFQSDDPSRIPSTLNVSLNGGGNFSKEGHRQSCDWYRYTRNSLYWNPGGGCSCSDRLNVWFLEGPATTMVRFDKVKLVQIANVEVNTCQIDTYGK